MLLWGIRENVHRNGQRAYKNTKIKLSFDAKAVMIIIVHYNGNWASVIGWHSRVISVTQTTGRLEI